MQQIINFKLRDFDKINPAGKEPNSYLSWFWLTEGNLWIKFGDQTIYEYSEEALQHFGNKSTVYNDYYIVRFLEDFTERFEDISISISLKLYNLTENIEQFRNQAQKWLEIYDTDEDEYSEFYFDEYDKLISWSYCRLFNSAHLIGGPHFSFFRYKDKIRIVWDTEHTLENGINLWTAKNGIFEMNYSDFVLEVKTFGENFFNAMEKQIKLTIEKEWGDVKVDKVRLLDEHHERKQDFNKNLLFLEQKPVDEKDWSEIEKLYERMKTEIK